MQTSSRPLILYIALSLDGYIADKSGGVDWLTSIGGGGDFGYAEFLQTVDALIMGGTTYRQLMHWGIPWPYEGLDAYVFTRKKMPGSGGVNFVDGNPKDFIETLRQKPGKKIWLMGGGDLVHQCLRDGIVDEFAFAFIPLLLGEGIRLFRGAGLKGLRLCESRAYGDVLCVRYEKISGAY